MEFMDRFKAAKRVSAPLVRLTTNDQPAALKMITRFFNPPKKRPENNTPTVMSPEEEKQAAYAAEIPIIEWDLINGARGKTPKSAAILDDALTAITRADWIEGGDDEPPPPMAQAKTKSPVIALQVFQYTPTDTVMALYNGNWYFGTESTRDGAAWGYAQALLNLRDANKEHGRMVILMGSDFSTIPKEMQNDILPLDEPLPTRTDLAAAITQEVRSWNDSHQDKPADQIEVDQPTIVKAVDNLRGIESNYVALQTIAMSISRKGLNTDELWLRNQQLINATPGLRVWQGTETYADVEGYDEIKKFYTRVLNGRKPVRGVVLIDEGEKQFAGANGRDGSSVTIEMVANVLTELEDKGYTGAIHYGPPGSGKSMMAKAVAGEGGHRLFYQDFSGAKGKYVGESNANVRRQYRVIDAVTDGAPLFIMTVNAMDLPTPLLRRFKLGTFFFDLPTEAELQKIWMLYMRKFEILNQEIPECKRWTGSDVRQCCELAWSLQIPLVEAKNYVIPVSVSAKKEIEAVRLGAVGKYLSASYPGKYKNPTPLPTKKGESGGRTYQEEDTD